MHPSHDRSPEAAQLSVKRRARPASERYMVGASWVEFTRSTVWQLAADGSGHRAGKRLMNSKKRSDRSAPVVYGAQSPSEKSPLSRVARACATVLAW